MILEYCSNALVISTENLKLRKLLDNFLKRYDQTKLIGRFVGQNSFVLILAKVRSDVRITNPRCLVEIRYMHPIAL